MGGIWIAGLLLGILVFGLIGWLSIGVFTLLNRALYPTRLLAEQSPTAFGADFEDVRFQAQGDGITLSGWFVPTLAEKAHGAVILCHGMSLNREQMLSWAEPLWRCGFHVLLFDFRALGSSGGERVTGGYLEAQDVIGAAHYLAQRPDCIGLTIGVFGFSMGGSAAILAAAAEPRLRAIVTHGAYATLDRAIAQRCRRHFGPFAKVAELMVRYAGAKRFPIPPAKVTPLRFVSCLSPRPLLLLHGEQDPIVPMKDAYDLYAEAGEPKTLRLLPDSEHRRIHPVLYDDVQEQVIAFFRQNLTSMPDVSVCEPLANSR